MVSRKVFLGQIGLIGAGLAMKPVLSFAAATNGVNNTENPAEKRLNDLVEAMTLEEKADMLSGYKDFFIRPLPRLNIPQLSMADGPLGIASWGIQGRATAFPATIASCATWNREIMDTAGQAYAQEWRSRGIHFMLAPGVNIYRASKSGRNFEYFGEDPFLASEMVVPFIKAVQKGGVIATIKHFAANDQEFDRYSVSTQVDERTLREIYLPAFEAAVKKAGVWACMAAYNPVNGVWNTQNKWLLTDILKKEWGFKGMVMSDWGCTYSTVEAANNGLDLEMGSNEYFTKEKLIPAVKNGSVSVEVINDKVKRIYRPAIELGFFDRPQKLDDIPLYNPFANETARQTAREGCVLLKNDNNVLPLKRAAIKSVAVIGPNAQPVLVNDRYFRSGAYTYGGGGSSKVNPWLIESVLQGITSIAGKDIEVLYDEGVSNHFKDQTFRNAIFQTADGKPGLTGEYFNNSKLQGAPVLTRTDEHLIFEFSGDNHKIQGLGTKNYSIAWTGFIVPDKTADATFFVDAQGAYRLFVDKQLLIDKSKSQSFANEYTGVKFKANEKMEVRLEFIYQCDPAEIKLGYSYTPDFKGSEAVKIAKKADVVIFCGGLDSQLELEGTDRGFNLPYGQDQLIDAITQVNKNTVVTILAGGGINMSAWAGKVPAILHAWYPGMEGGRVIGEILFGDVNPSGKLPISIEKRWEDAPAYGNYDDDRASGKVYYREGIMVGYRHYDKNKVEPLFPFGHGLSYTQFSYQDIVLSSKKIKKGEILQVSFTVTNTGKLPGAEVAQLYISDKQSSVPRPVKELKGFEKTWLKPQESKKITLNINQRDLSFYDVKSHNWVAEPGEFEVLVGSSSKQIHLTSVFVLG